MIKKVTMFVDVDEEELLKEDEYYKKKYEESLEDSTPEKAVSKIVDDYLNVVKQDCYLESEHIIGFSYTVDDVTDGDKEKHEYQRLAKEGIQWR